MFAVVSLRDQLHRGWMVLCRHPDWASKSSLAAVIDLKLLRENPDAVRRSQLSRGEDPALVDALLTADAARQRDLDRDSLQAERNDRQQKRGWRVSRERARRCCGARRTRRAGQSRPGPTRSKRRRRPPRRTWRLRCHRGRGYPPAGGRLRGARQRAQLPRTPRTWSSAVAGPDRHHSAAPGVRFTVLLPDRSVPYCSLDCHAGAEASRRQRLCPTVPPVLPLRPEVMSQARVSRRPRREVYRVEGDGLSVMGRYHGTPARFWTSRGPAAVCRAESSCSDVGAGSHGKDTRGIIRCTSSTKVGASSTAHRPTRGTNMTAAGLAAPDAGASRCRIGSSTWPRDLGSSARTSSTASVDSDAEAYRELTSTSNHHLSGAPVGDRATGMPAASSRESQPSTERWPPRWLVRPWRTTGPTAALSPRRTGPFVGVQVLEPVA